MASNPVALGVAALMNRRPDEQKKATRGRAPRRDSSRSRRVRQERDG
jgi:hypothetical protein